jgi:sodium/potassium-transporting ATPase subunit alpha
LDGGTFATVQNVKDQWSTAGKRVILLARKVLPTKGLSFQFSTHEFEDEVMNHARADLILVGLVGIVDPPRDEIPEVVKTLRTAGIRIFMVGFLCH